jgi:hypothetical protein
MPPGIYVSKNRYFHQMWQAKEAFDKEIAREDSIFVCNNRANANKT